MVNIAQNEEDQNSSSNTPLKETSDFMWKVEGISKDLFNSKQDSKAFLSEFKQRISQIKNQRQKKEEDEKENADSNIEYENNEIFEQYVNF